MPNPCPNPKPRPAQKHGHKWCKIAQSLPCTVPRTDDATRNRWHRLMNKQGRLDNERPASGDDVSPPKRPRPHARAKPTTAQTEAAVEAAEAGGKHDQRVESTSLLVAWHLAPAGRACCLLLQYGCWDVRKVGVGKAGIAPRLGWKQGPFGIL